VNGVHLCPARGVGACSAALVLPTVSTEAMSLHLAEINTQVASGAHAVTILDGAGWHQTGGKLRMPDNISLLPLPPYSPELNPVEIVDACCSAWNALAAAPATITSIASREWAKTVNP